MDMRDQDTLLLAAVRSHDLTYIEHSIKNLEASPGAVADDFGNSIMHVAAAGGNPTIMDALLFYNGPTNVFNYGKQSIWFAAAESDNPETIGLLAKKAEEHLFTPDKAGFTALGYAELNNKPHAVKALQQIGLDVPQLKLNFSMHENGLILPDYRDDKEDLTEIFASDTFSAGDLINRWQQTRKGDGPGHSPRKPGL